MRNLFRVLIISAFITPAVSFAGWGESFSIGDSWNPGMGRSSWSTPNWGTSYRGPNWGRSNWGAPAYYPPPGYFYPPPRINLYDRNQMKQDRQKLMSGHDDAMDSLADMLYGRFRFDREQAVEFAREIEMNAGSNLLRNFHPGAIATSGSNTSTAIWTNEEVFKANAETLKQAAKDLIKELQRKPEAPEDVIYPRLDKGFDYRARNKVQPEPVSPGIFDKFNVLSTTCMSCHTYFRLPD